MSKRVQTQDRHEHGGLPDTIRLRPANQGRMLYEVSVDDDGHATVTCHCALCEKFRRVMAHDEAVKVG